MLSRLVLPVPKSCCFPDIVTCILNACLSAYLNFGIRFCLRTCMFVVFRRVFKRNASVFRATCAPMTRFGHVLAERAYLISCVYVCGLAFRPFSGMRPRSLERNDVNFVRFVNVL